MQALSSQCTDSRSARLYVCRCMHLYAGHVTAHCEALAALQRAFLSTKKVKSKVLKCTLYVYHNILLLLKVSTIFNHVTFLGVIQGLGTPDNPRMGLNTCSEYVICTFWGLCGQSEDGYVKLRSKVLNCMITIASISRFACHTYTYTDAIFMYMYHLLLQKCHLPFTGKPYSLNVHKLDLKETQ